MTNLKFYLSLGAIALAIAAFWFAVVSPQLQLKDAEIARQQASIDLIKAEQEKIKTDIQATENAAVLNAEAIDRLSKVSTRDNLRSGVIREEIVNAGKGSAPKPIGASSKAYFEQVAKDQEARK